MAKNSTARLGMLRWASLCISDHKVKIQMYIYTEKNYVSVSNSVSYPWFIKKIQIKKKYMCVCVYLYVCIDIFKHTHT